MQFKTHVLFAASCVSFLAMSIPAYSVPAPSGLEHQRNSQRKNIAQHVLVPQAKRPAARESRGAHLFSMPIAEAPKRPMFGWPVLVREARRYLGTNPTRRSRLWCATFMNMVLANAGYIGTNSDAAKSFASYGHRISDPEVGAIAVLTRGNNGGHVGVVTGVDPQGNPIIISGNHGRRVGEAIYPRSRVIAYVMPSDRRPVSEPQVTEPQVTEPQVTERAMANPQAAPNRAPSEHGIESPIAELLAAIEIEQNRSAAKPVRPLIPSTPPASHLAAQQMPPTVPHLTVQQMPEWSSQAVQQPLPPHLTPPRPQPRRHIASADEKIIRQ